MELVVQWVRTSWTKRSRGGKAAARRNATPVAFRLPEERGPLVHHVVMDEAEDFAPRIEVREGRPDEEELDLRDVDDRLRVQLRPSAWGMPKRHRRPPAVFLNPGEWLRWQINYRFSGGCPCGEEWSYRLDTLNIAHGQVSADAFLGRPAYKVDERGYLR